MKTRNIEIGSIIDLRFPDETPLLRMKITAMKDGRVIFSRASRVKGSWWLPINLVKLYGSKSPGEGGT